MPTVLKERISANLVDQAATRPREDAASNRKGRSSAVVPIIVLVAAAIALTLIGAMFAPPPAYVSPNETMLIGP